MTPRTTTFTNCPACEVRVAVQGYTGGVVDHPPPLNTFTRCRVVRFLA